MLRSKPKTQCEEKKIIQKSQLTRNMKYQMEITIYLYQTWYLSSNIIDKNFDYTTHQTYTT